MCSSRINVHVNENSAGYDTFYVILFLRPDSVLGVGAAGSIMYKSSEQGELSDMLLDDPFTIHRYRNRCGRFY